MAEEEVLRRLDRLIGLFELAHQDELQRARESVRTDKTYAAILASTDTEMAAGKLKKAVQTKTRQSPKTVERRIADLIEIGALERIGAGGSVGYRATGLI